MMTFVHRSLPGGTEWLGRVTRVSPATAHAVGCVAAFASVMTGGIHLTDAADWSGLARSRALLATAEAHAADARRLIAAAAQRREAGPPTGRDASSARAQMWPALMLELADLAGESGLQIASLEPRHAEDPAPDGRRTVKVVADGNFPALLRLMDGLASFSALAVPSAVHVERTPRASRIDMTIDVYPALSGARVLGGTARPLAGARRGDPFGGADSSAMVDDAVPRLAGTIRDARAGLALFDAGDGAFSTVAPGEALGVSRVVTIGTDAVTLATADGIRRFVVDDGGRP
ncbi:pilus assembly protein [Burkholderia sp. Nafp2/4-1b]|uniref:pilus assembly protein n=1 Tax=Burkholderia sp. Nafp2/4-1b TaxID=2116686 RepID=UPI000EF96A90|nr:pilus assembly protein [Burkholderia sp. Nafp2/4-1b]RKU02974.1 pilus assembly protein [Burkholderia sp. Nafp2/4-1b]